MGPPGYPGTPGATGNPPVQCLLSWGQNSSPGKSTDELQSMDCRLESYCWQGYFCMGLQQVSKPKLPAWFWIIMVEIKKGPTQRIRVNITSRLSTIHLYIRPRYDLSDYHRWRVNKWSIGPPTPNHPGPSVQFCKSCFTLNEQVPWWSRGGAGPGYSQLPLCQPAHPVEAATLIITIIITY